MLNQLKRLGGDSLLYALMNVGTKLIAFLMLPIFTAYLSKEELGVLENVDAFTSMITFLVIFGTDSALAFYYFDTEDKDKRSQYFRNILMFRLVVALFFLLLSVVAGPFVSQMLLKQSGYEHIIQIGLAVLVFEAVITLVLTYYRFEFLTKRVVFATVARLGIIAVVTYLLLRFFSPHVEAVFYARIIGVLLIIAFLLPQIKRFFTFKIDVPLLKEMLKYAAPLVPASIAFWIISTSNRFFLTQFEGLGQAGIYGVVVKFATVITLLTSSVQMAWRPYSMSIKAREDAKSIFSTIYLLILAGGMFGLIGIATFIPYILEWMIAKPEYHVAGKYIPILSLGTFLNFYYLIISVGLFIEKQTKPISFYFAIAAAISVVLNIALIPLFSLWGAVSAVTLSYLFACVAIFIKSQKVYYVPVSIPKMVWIFTTGLVSFLAITYIQEYTDLSFLYVIIPWLFFLGAAGAVLVRRKGKRVEGAH